MNSPVEVQGKLTKSGQPVSSVTLMLHPLETGHPVPLKVGADGTFKGNVVPGRYSFYLVAGDSSDLASFNALDSSLKEPSMTRTVNIGSGQSKLDVEL